jgi:hypothetical protein
VERGTSDARSLSIDTFPARRRNSTLQGDNPSPAATAKSKLSVKLQGVWQCGLVSEEGGVGVWGGGGYGLARGGCAGFRDGYPLCGGIKTEAHKSAAAAVAADYFAALEGYSISECAVVSVVELPC